MLGRLEVVGVNFPRVVLDHGLGASFIICRVSRAYLVRHSHRQDL